jgi:hypothetical protein
MVSFQIMLLGAPTSLASIMVIGPHHAAVTHVGCSSEVGQREHMVRLGIHRKCWSEFLCLGEQERHLDATGGHFRGEEGA